MILPSLRIVEELRTVDVAHDMVDIILIDDDLGVSAFDELLAEFLQRGIYLYRLNLGTWHHTVAHLGI